MSESEDENAVVQEDEVFEITDFTNASDWESFITQIEEIITNWNLTSYVKLQPLQNNEITNGDWEAVTAHLKFTNVPFTMTLHRLKFKPDTEQFVEELDEEDDDKIPLPQYVEDMMCIDNDFPARAHCIARWYGLRCFLILSISSSNGITNQSKCNLLTSSVSIALNNMSCDVPFFVQIQENWRRMYEGKAVSTGMSTQFEMVHLKKCPQQYAYLSGLLYLFKNKIGLTSLLSGETRVSARFTYVLHDWGIDGKWPAKPPDPEAVASHFGTLLYGCLEDPVTELQLAAVWPSMTGDLVIDNDIHSDFKPLSAPRWVVRLCYADDLTCLLSSYLYEFIKATNRTESMSDLLNVLEDHTTDKHLGQALEKITDPSAGGMLPGVKLASGLTKVVTDSQTLFRKSAYTLGRIAAVRGRIPREVLNNIKSYMFFQESTNSRQSSSQQQQASTYTFYHKLKAAPIDSLTHHLAMCAIVVNLCHGGLSALAQVWHVFVSELRTMLDNGECLPGIDSSKPDLNTCLLHQKLQMLNCCIQRKVLREQRSPRSSSEVDFKVNPSFVDISEDLTESNNHNNHMATDESKNETTPLKEVDKYDGNLETSENAAASSNHSERLSSNDSRGKFSVQSDDEDEFFECESDIDLGDTEQKHITSGDQHQEISEQQSLDQVSFTVNSNKTEDGAIISRDDVEHSTNENKDSMVDIDVSYPAEGRLKPCDDLNLLHCNSSLFIPHTQDHAPVTEDQLEEQAEVFSKLGDTKEGSKVRAKMQSASLRSDMEAFKSANPGCVLEDFVRWYSPRDFENGELSQRMKIPQNLWVTTWKSAKPVPAHRQKRIFDDTKEAEKVLHFLTNLKPAEAAQMLIPVCTHEALLVLRLASDAMKESLPSLPLICNQIEARAAQIFKQWHMYGSVANQFQPWTKDIQTKVEDLFRQITFAETMIERARSLQHKFRNLGDMAQVNAFVRQLLEHPEVPLDEAAVGPVGCIIKYYFQNQQNIVVEAESSLSSEQSEDVRLPKEIPPLPKPAGREFIIRASNSYPSTFSRKLPHRMYAVLMQNEFRLASAVSHDSTFF
ncbi:rab3 GTPase-activating protein catalytic subunit-like isoform X1 [Clavelina lepadiformis]|uniref:rab3 GTPase-activating protein catalytic subunit-like isoform X1 n=2 Tax=Clavelina lepadiformis TaxID=159417 RepID=UPI00404363E1